MSEQLCLTTDVKKDHKIHYQYLCVFLIIFFLYSCSTFRSNNNQTYWEQRAKEEMMAREAVWCKNYLLNCPDDLNDPSSIPVLINVIDNDPECQARAWALTSLSKIKPRTEQITSYIVKSLKEPECTDKIIVAMEIPPTIGNRINEVIPELLNYIINKPTKTQDGNKERSYSDTISKKACDLVGDIALSDERIIEALKLRGNEFDRNDWEKVQDAATKSYRKLTSLVIKSTDQAKVTPAATHYNLPVQRSNHIDSIEPVQLKKRLR